MVYLIGALHLWALFLHSFFYPTLAGPGSLPATQPTSQPAPKEDLLDETLVTAPRPDPIQSPTGGQVIVLQPDSLFHARSSAADVLQKIPGVVVRSQGGDGQRQVILLRGASEEQVLVLLDGVRLNEAGGGGVDLSLLPASSIERIEVITGAAAALYGAEAMGGVILLKTRSTYTNNAAELSLSLRSFHSTRLNAARVGQLGRWGILGQLSLLESRGDFFFLDTNDQPRIRQNNDAQQLYGIVKAERSLKGPWRLSLLGQASLVQRGVPGPEQFESLTATQEGKRILLLSQLSGREVSPGLAYHFFAAFRLGELSFVDPEPGLGLPVDSQATELAPSLGWRFAFSPTKEGALSKLGGDFSWSYEQLFSEDVSGGEAHRLRGSMAFYTEAAFGPLLLSPALRFEGVSTFGLAPIPRLGASLSLTERTSVTLSAGRSYRAPSLKDLFLRLDGLVGDPDLQPEDAWEVAPGVLWSNETLLVSASVFGRKIQNLILFVPESAFLVKASNFSGFTAYGAELRSSLSLGQFVLEGGYTFTHTEEPNGLSLPGLPRQRLSSRLSWQRGFFQFFAGADLQEEFFTNRHNTQTAPARKLLSAGAALSLAKTLELSLEGQNLLNQEFLTDAIQLPLPPRVFTATLRGVF